MLLYRILLNGRRWIIFNRNLCEQWKMVLKLARQHCAASDLVQIFTGDPLSATSYLRHLTGDLLPVTSYRSPARGFRISSLTLCRMRSCATFYRLPHIDELLPSTSYRWLLTSDLLPAISYRPPLTSDLLQATSYQQPFICDIFWPTRQIIVFIHLCLHPPPVVSDRWSQINSCTSSMIPAPRPHTPTSSFPVSVVMDLSKRSTALYFVITYYLKNDTVSVDWLATHDCSTTVNGPCTGRSRYTQGWLFQLLISKLHAFN